MTNLTRRRSIFARRRQPPYLLTLLLIFLLSACCVSKAKRIQKTQKRLNSPRPSSRWTDFPLYQDTVELARVSHLVYKFRGQGSCNATEDDGITPLLPPDLDCHLYFHSQTQGTQLLILTSDRHSFLAVVYAGTDDLRTMLTDSNILEKPFGPLNENGDSIILPGPSRVHAGFDDAVFDDGLYDMILEKVDELHRKHSSYRIFTTGHSLGGANSLLTAVALARHYPDLPITSISFGCPKTGNYYWRDAIHNEFDNLSIWRFVHGWDLVPRLPEYPFEHVGHTVQMNPSGMNAYYLHNGNETLGYASVPLGWSSKVWIWVPGAVWSHSCSKYEDYLHNESALDPDTYFVHDFVPVTRPDDLMDDDLNDDPAWNLPDDLFFRDDETKDDGELDGWIMALDAMVVQH